MFKRLLNNFRIKNRFFLTKNALKLTSGLSLSYLTYKYLNLDQKLNNDVLFLETRDLLLKRLKIPLPEILEKKEPYIFALKNKDGQIVSNGVYITDGIIAVFLENHKIEEFNKKDFSLHSINDLKDCMKDESDR